MASRLISPTGDAGVTFEAAIDVMIRSSETFERARAGTAIALRKRAGRRDMDIALVLAVAGAGDVGEA